ncbi:hypothetical protein HK104_000294 [Borealophlyctis nickersoniae]|nr:hypothetical protein HK104_000294 [Borealophlyctis nickersoniae]
MSFFGFDTTLPDASKAPPGGRSQQGRGQDPRFRLPDNRETFGEELGGQMNDDDDTEEAFGSRLDEMLEAKFAYGGNLEDEGLDAEGGGIGGALEDDDEDLNDETFGESAAADKIDREFDFTAGNEFFKHEPGERNVAAASGEDQFDESGRDTMRKPNFKHLWEQPLPGEMKRAMSDSWHQSGPSQQQGQRFMPPSGSVTLEEIEAELMRNARGSAGPPQGGLDPRMVDPRGMAMGPPMGHQAMDPRLNARQVDRGHVDPGILEMRGMDPRSIDPRAVDPRLLDGRNFPSLAEMEMALRAQQRQRGPPGPYGSQSVPGMGPGPMGGLPPMNQQGFRRPLPQLGHYFPSAQRGMAMNNRGQRHDYPHHQQRHPDRRGQYPREDYRPREERYKGLMTQREKELIAKIQIAQLVTDDPYADDFYYQIYTALVSVSSQSSNQPGGADGSSGSKSLNWQQNMLMSQGRGNSMNVTNQMQMQMQRLIDQRKQRPKGTSLALEGALGKISINSVRNPKRLIQVTGAGSNKENNDHNLPQFSLLSHRKVLKTIENVYLDVLDLEQMKRKGPEGDDVEAWNAEFTAARMRLWNHLGLDENVPISMPHPFAYFLSYAKGKRVIPRVLRFLSPDQTLHLLTTLLARLESVDVCNITAGTPSEAVDLFIANVIPPLVSVISEVPLHVVNTCMRILLERHNMVWLAKSKTGLAFLTMFLSRAEILKQVGGGGGAPAEAELAMWADIYNFLFASLHTHFASIFPSPPPSQSQPSVQQQALADEVYVWQFLAAMAVGATTVDHQRVLLTEVRSNVLETSRRSVADNPKSVANVNLFLNALGLGIDASQLAAMPA